MKLRLHFFDDQRLDEAQIGALTSQVSDEMRLTLKDIVLTVENIVRIGNDESDATSAEVAMRACLAQATLTNLDPNILFVDLVLTDHGLQLATQIDIYNSVVSTDLALSARSNILDKARCGGYALAWNAFRAAGHKNLMVIATGAHAEDAAVNHLGRVRAEAIVAGHAATISYYAEGDSISNANPEDRKRYIKRAVEKWLGMFWSPRARLHPEGSNAWFDGTRTSIPHNFSDITTAYQRVVCDYLAAVLQIPVAEAVNGYTALSEEHKPSLHEYLKAVVGNDAACHRGRGGRLQWRHLPLLAAVCAPAPGAWIFTNDFPWRACDSILPAGTGGCDESLLDCLIGKQSDEVKGAFSVLLTDKDDTSLSRLDAITSSNGHCEIKVTYGTEELKTNFDNGITLSTRPTNDCSGILWDLHHFLAAHGRGVRVNMERIILIQNTEP